MRLDVGCYRVCMKLLGHHEILTALTRAKSNNGIHHAYLFAGPKGVGKRRVAQWYAALVNCEVSGEPCGSCRLCRRILDLEGSHPDIVILEPEGRQITINQVRDLIRTVPYPPIEAPFRTVIIDRADAIGEAAANALLKTLEEPPSKTRFVLVTDRPDALLITIRSRCQRISFGRLTREQVLEGLSDAGISETQASVAANIADGSLGAALALAEDELVSQRESLLGRVMQCPPGDISEAFAIAQDFSERTQQLPTLFELLKRFYRDLLLLKTESADTIGLTYPGLREGMSLLAKSYNTAGILYRLELVEETRYAMLQRNVNAKLSLERLVTTLTASPGQERAQLHPKLTGRTT